MPKQTVVRISFALLLSGVCVTQTTPMRAASGQHSSPAADKTSVAAEMKAGEAADAKNDYATAMADYQKAVELDPGNAEAHKHFINAAMNQADAPLVKVLNDPDYAKLEKGQLHGKARKAMQAAEKKASKASKSGDDALLATYDRWIAAYPKIPAVYWAKGYVLDMLEKVSGKEEMFQKALSLDSKFVPAYNSMAELEYQRGDYARQREYLKQVMDLDPHNAEAARNYAEAFQFSDAAQFRQLAQEYAERFPKDSDCTYMLYQLENTEPAPADRIAVLEAMRRDDVDKPVSTKGMENPDIFTGWLESSMLDLFNLYAQRDSKKALDLAREVQKQKWADPEWKSVVDYQQNLVSASGMIADKKYADALALLQKSFTGYFVTRAIDHTPADLAKAEALAGSGKLQQAFDGLASEWSKSPTPALKTALLEYGSRLGKNPRQVDDAIWQQWTAKAKKMKPFDLRESSGKQKVKLSDYRGRVILVNFWFPLCGPCRGELPYLDQVARKYQPQGFQILAINGIPAQDGYVSGVLKNYDVIGLEVPSKNWAQKYDHVRGYPTNYLLDGQGRVLAHPYVRSVNELRVLEAQIDAILARNSKS